MIKKYSNILKYEMLLGIKETLQYRVSLISELLIFSVTYIIVMFVNTGENFMDYYGVDGQKSSFLILIGFIFWQISSISMGYSASNVENESKKGTLELKVQSCFSVPMLFFFRVMVKVLIRSVNLIGLVLLTALFANINGYDLVYVVVTLILTIPSIIGAYGIGLLLGGVALGEKSVDQFSFIIQTLLLFISNVTSPVSHSIMVILPFSKGIEISRELYLGLPLDTSKVILYLGINSIWLLLGIMFFSYRLKEERTVGSFDTY